MGGHDFCPSKNSLPVKRKVQMFIWLRRFLHSCIFHVIRNLASGSETCCAYVILKYIWVSWMLISFLSKNCVGGHTEAYDTGSITCFYKYWLVLWWPSCYLKIGWSCPIWKNRMAIMTLLRLCSTKTLKSFGRRKKPTRNKKTCWSLTFIINFCLFFYFWWTKKKVISKLPPFDIEQQQSRIRQLRCRDAAARGRWRRRDPIMPILF